MVYNELVAMDRREFYMKKLFLALFLLLLVGCNSMDQAERDLEASIGVTESEASRLSESIKYVQENVDSASFDEAYEAVKESARVYGVDDNINSISKNVAVLSNASGVKEHKIARVAHNLQKDFDDLEDQQEVYDLLAGVYQKTGEDVFPSVLDAYDKYGSNMLTAGLTSQDFFAMSIETSKRGVEYMNSALESVSHEMIGKIRSKDEKKMKTLKEMFGSKEKAEEIRSDIINGGTEGREAVLQIIEYFTE